MSKSKVTKSPVKGAPQTPTMIHEHIDNFLAKIVGETPVDDKPRNSTEFWLNEIAENLPGGGTEVIANPTLAGTEDVLTGLQVGDTKYKVDTSQKLYEHNITMKVTSNNSILGAIHIITTDSAKIDSASKLANLYMFVASNDVVIADFTPHTGYTWEFSGKKLFPFSISITGGANPSISLFGIGYNSSTQQIYTAQDVLPTNTVFTDTVRAIN